MHTAQENDNAKVCIKLKRDVVKPSFTAKKKKKKKRAIFSMKKNKNNLHGTEGPFT